MAKFLISKQRRAIWLRRIKGFWEEYKHNKIGLVGGVAVIVYLVGAIIAPWLTPYDPIQDKNLADDFAMPEWVTIFPQYRDLPRTMGPPLSWSAIGSSGSIQIVESGENIVLNYAGDGTDSIHFINFTAVFLYPYAPPNRFTVKFAWWTKNVTNAEYSMELFMVNPVGTRTILWTTDVPPISFPFFGLTANKNFTSAYIDSMILPQHIILRLGINPLYSVPNVARERIFLEKGEYTLLLCVRFRSKSENGTAEIHFQNSKLKILGSVHGILGTDVVGRDIFSQLVNGARISLAVGLLAAVLGTSIGLSYGIISGYTGGYVDEAMMRLVDILLCLPILPLLLGLIVIFGTSVWYLVLLIAVFGWQGFSRVIRSQVLSLKEMPFVECARAAGASRFYIMLKHMLPNVIPVAMASLVLSVPGAILTEAGISFIGLGDPTAPTWGRMLHYAFRTGGFWHLAWWWILPPGLAITILTLSFVFIGHAVDEIVNPRLRRRR